MGGALGGEEFGEADDVRAASTGFLEELPSRPQILLLGEERDVLVGIGQFEAHGAHCYLPSVGRHGGLLAHCILNTCTGQPSYWAWLAARYPLAPWRRSRLPWV